MSLAVEHHALIRERVVAAAFIATSPGNLDEVYRLNAEYHATLNGLAGSPVVSTTVGTLIHASVLQRTLHAFDDAAMRRSVNHHLEIVAALRARDGDWAEAVMHAHLLSARASLLGPRRQVGTPEESA